ncbi:hypothetical protein J5N97_023966 [Dioscorea zingiberensis]|uniref:MSP domain-containing protein n=1 Tax=Dioscorea zingiberensis TaxID=325984 RepID=A0A9D5C6K4_9LILI|nr:hypothetical protein J5N97_023966 [Dioscorea zingiberensis]
MSAGDLLGIEPLELKFPFELKKQISCSLQLSNKTDEYVAFKVKTTSPKKYCVRPNTGVVSPRSTCDVIVTMQAQREMPPDMQCKDKFLVQSVVTSHGASPKDITPEMFTKESGNAVDEVKLRVVYVSPPQPPSPVPEGSEEGSSPRPSISDNGNMATSELANLQAARAFVEPQERPSETKALITRLTEEKNSAIQLNNKLHQELELLRREVNKQTRGGFSFIYVTIEILRVETLARGFIPLLTGGRTLAVNDGGFIPRSLLRVQTPAVLSITFSPLHSTVRACGVGS